MTATKPMTIGIDFGTTNTVVALTDADGLAHLVTFDAVEGQTTTFRSALSFQTHPGVDGQPPERVVEAGPWAIAAYVEDPLETRFIQSFKTFAASAAFTETRIDNKRYAFEDLLAAFLLRLRHHAGDALTDAPPAVIVGRPVTFAGGNPDETLALSRYQTAFERLGFTDIRYAHEPVGAAFYFARKLTQDATVLVADFGGGTSDFSIIRFERTGDGLRSTPLARTALEPEKIERLIEVLDDNHGHDLYRAVSTLKMALSADDQATFLFQAGGVHIEKPVARADFERWIAPELAAIEGAVDQAMARSGLAPDAIDRVFLTGGTSFVPAVRALFQNRFGAERIETGGEFESIAAGLALIGREADLDLWSETAV